MLNTLCADYLLSIAEGHRTNTRLSDIRDEAAFRSFLEPILNDVGFVAQKRQFTDDSVQALAIAQWLMSGPPLNELLLEPLLRDIAKRYESRVNGYGKTFTSWLHGRALGARSASNGCLMRLEPILVASPNLEVALRLAWLSTRLTHRHPDAWKAVYLYVSLYFELVHTGNIWSQEKVLQSYCKQLRVSPDLEILRASKKFQLAALDCLGAALTCVIGARSYWDVLANVAYVGGDCDTVGVVACTLAGPLLGSFPQGKIWLEKSLGSEPFLYGISSRFEEEKQTLSLRLG